MFERFPVLVRKHRSGMTAGDQTGSISNEFKGEKETNVFEKSKYYFLIIIFKVTVLVNIISF